jgi:hypothetical protein
VTSPTPKYESHPRLPKDRDGDAIQVLSVEESTVLQLDITGANDREALPANAEVVEIAASNTCRIVFGDSSVDATVGVRRIFPIGVAVYRVPLGATHIACVQVDGSTGFVTVARMV